MMNDERLISQSCDTPTNDQQIILILQIRDENNRRQNETKGEQNGIKKSLLFET